MFEDEIIFYNGFNLGVDILIFVTTAWIFSRIYYRYGYQDGKGDGYSQATIDIDDGILVKEYCPDNKELTWTIKTSKEATVHSLFNTKEVD
jgi:hypothetical protein